MIVLYVNVVEVHLLVEVFLLKDWIFFVLIVVNESNTINQKPVVDNVVFLVIITKQTRAKNPFSFFFFYSTCILWWKSKQNWTIIFPLLLFLNDIPTIQLISFVFLSFIPLNQNENNWYISSFLPFCSYFSFSLYCVSFFFFICSAALSLSLSFFPIRIDRTNFISMCICYATYLGLFQLSYLPYLLQQSYIY